MSIGVAGIEWKSQSSTEIATYTGGYSPQTTGLTVLVVARRDGVQPDSGFALAVTLTQVSGAQDPFQLFIKDSGERIRVNTTTTDNTLSVETATDWPVGVMQVGVYSWSSGSVPEAYRNGIKQVLSNNYYGSNIPTGVLKPAQSLRVNLPSLRLNGAVAAVLIWDRKLSDAEVASISANPWQIFRRFSRPLFTPTGESGVLIPDLTSPGVIDITANTAKPELNVQY
jgi:hypothetical protein